MSSAERETPLHIVQIAPEIAAGSGVAGVAAALEREFALAGVQVEGFTLARARGRVNRTPRRALARRLSAAWDVVWFSTTGSRRARRFLAARPDAVSICHNDVMAGDVYVNHGLLQPSMRARGGYLWRMLRNPVHVFTTLRDRRRYRGGTHRAVVALTAAEAALLTATYGRVAAPITVIPNGVDLERFRPPTLEERRRSRDAAGVPADGAVAIFVGHEFERKGLPLAIDALASAPGAVLLVVGGTTESIGSARARAAHGGVAERVVFAGTHADPVPLLWAADLLVLPSAYEANALVVLEALACGLPVISTRVGFAPELIVDGRNGYLIDRDPSALAARMSEFAGADRTDWAERARRSAEPFAWGAIAGRYIALAQSLRRTPRPPSPRGIG